MKFLERQNLAQYLLSNHEDDPLKERAASGRNIYFIPRGIQVETGSIVEDAVKHWRCIEKGI